MAKLYAFNGRRPKVHPSVFLAPNAVLIGDIEIGPESSVWFGAVLRSDEPDPANGIRIGARTSIQDNCVIHVSKRGPTIVGNDCTIGHGAVFESCTIGDGTLVGMNAVILQGAVIGKGSVVAAMSMVPEGMQVGDGMLVAGVPAVIKKPLSGSSASWMASSPAHYVKLSREHLESLVEVDRDE